MQSGSYESKHSNFINLINNFSLCFIEMATLFVFWKMTLLVLIGKTIRLFVRQSFHLICIHSLRFFSEPKAMSAKKKIAKESQNKGLARSRIFRTCLCFYFWTHLRIPQAEPKKSPAKFRTFGNFLRVGW